MIRSISTTVILLTLCGTIRAQNSQDLTAEINSDGRPPVSGSLKCSASAGSFFTPRISSMKINIYQWDRRTQKSKFIDKAEFAFGPPGSINIPVTSNVFKKLTKGESYFTWVEVFDSNGVLIKSAPSYSMVCP